jgi:hypothetical protein
MKRPTSIQLARLKRHPQFFDDFMGRKVRIWSKEWKAWWRQHGAGYTTKENEAGIYLFEDAFKQTAHCGPEKGIVYYAI